MTAIDQALEAASSATKEFCDTVLSMELNVRASEGPESESGNLRTQVSVSLVGADVAFQLIMITGDKSCRTFSRALFGMEDGEEVSDQDVADGMGEVANIIAGGLKSRLVDDYPGLTLGLPTLGGVHEPVLYPSRVSVGSQPTSIGGHPVLLMVMMEEKNGSSARSQNRVGALQHAGR